MAIIAHGPPIGSKIQRKPFTAEDQRYAEESFPYSLFFPVFLCVLCVLGGKGL
jgi:hypothetical protein